MATTSSALVFNIFARNQTSSGLKGVAVGFAGLAGAVGLSIKKAADFDKTIRLAGAASGATQVQLKTMQEQALKVGTATQFGAQGAAEAMLELAKGGITPAQMAAGALAGTMTLASAGGLELGAAATYMSNALNTFGLKATDAASVAAALAGGANASTASVESLGQALSQVGPGATNAGLSLEETVAALAAFDNAGIKGSDAGTSLKTMLTRLVPPTNSAQKAADALGLAFTNSDGSFKSLAEIAQILQDKMGGLSEEQRVIRLNTIFGSDATRAATVLMKEGAAGIEKYTKATTDRAAAEVMAKEQTAGAAGAARQFSSAIDSLQIMLALYLLPAFTKVTQVATKVVGWMGQHKTMTLTLIAVVGGLAGVILTVSAVMRAYAAAQRALVVVTRMAMYAQLALNSSFLANPVVLVITAIVALGAAVLLCYKKFDTFRYGVNGVIKAVVGGWATMVSGMLGMMGKLVGAMAHLPGPLGAPFRGAKKAIDAARGSIEALKDKVESLPTSRQMEIDANVASALRKLEQVRIAQAGITGSMGISVSAGGGNVQGRYGGMRASGGPVQAGTAYLVGERGPEMLVMGRQSGTVVPSARRTAAARETPELRVVFDVRGADREMLALLRRMVRVEGQGSAEKAFGRAG